MREYHRKMNTIRDTVVGEAASFGGIRVGEAASFGGIRRLGLTLIEVLAAIGVAAIGVFGVLVLVPLASRMSQVGISNEATRQSAANVIEKVKSFGALETNRWVRYEQVADAFLPMAVNPQAAYCLDPMLIAAPQFSPDLPATNTQTVNIFPYTSAGFTALPMDRVSLRRAPGLPILPIGAGMAEAMMGERNMVRTTEPLNDLQPPLQAFIRDPATNAAVKREMEGSKTALVLVLPTDRLGGSVKRLLSIVTTNRRFDLGNFDRVFQVLDPFPNPDPQFISKGSGVMDLLLDETDAAAPGENLHSRGWVILVPWYQDGNGINQYSWQHARPYQIRSSDPIANNRFRVTMVGMPYTAPSLASIEFGVHPGNLQPMGTRAIYIPGAVDIRESEVRLGSSDY